MPNHLSIPARLNSSRRPEMTPEHSHFPARLSSSPETLRQCRWDGGSFTTAYRPPTVFVEGEIQSSNHLVMVTLQGGARRHEISADDGHRFDGPDRPGSVSFLPANCVRRLRLHKVEWRWAAIALAPDKTPALRSLEAIGPFSGVQDVFVQGLLSEFDRLEALDGQFDTLWRESMVDALVAYLSRRYTNSKDSQVRRAHALTSRQLRGIADFVEANLSGEIRTADLAAVCRISEGHLHRAFRATTGVTPLQFVNAKRVDLARHLLATSELSVSSIAYRVGFNSSSHFALIFRRDAGCTPAEFRQRYRIG